MHMEALTPKAGFGCTENAAPIAEAAFRLLTPCLEAAAMVASEYARACGREVMTSRDFACGLKFAARHVLGRQTESFFTDEEMDEGEEEEEEEAALTMDEGEEQWTRYEGGDARMQLVNQAVDTWDDWVPSSPVEWALKRSVDATIINH
jgi:hypothetical protein